jgi:hypothetical protein
VGASRLARTWRGSFFGVQLLVVVVHHPTEGQPIPRYLRPCHSAPAPGSSKHGVGSMNHQGFTGCMRACSMDTIDAKEGVLQALEWGQHADVLLLLIACTPKCLLHKHGMHRVVQQGCRRAPAFDGGFVIRVPIILVDCLADMRHNHVLPRLLA